MLERENKLLTVAVLGGTGKEGSGLALRWADAGYRVVIGSREAARAQEKATELNETLGGEYVAGASNEEAAQQANVVVLSVPYSAHRGTLESVRDYLDGKVLIDVTVPTPYKAPHAEVPSGLSAAQEAQEFLGAGVRVVSAFQNVSAVHLKKLGHPVDCDVLVCGDDEEAKNHAIQLVEAAGMRGIDAGPLPNAIAAEVLTPILAYVNRRYNVKGAGLRITGLAE